MPPFHVYSPFPTSDPRSYPILEVSQFEYLGLILDPKLIMHLATVEAIRRASKGQALALAVSYSLRYDKNSSQLTPTQNLGLWKSIVLPHFLQNLRYIHSDTDIKMQTSLNLSLARVLHVYGDHTGLLADTGIPPLQLTRYVHLPQLHFRLTITRPDTLPALLFKKLNSSLPLPSLHTSTLDYHIRYATHAFKIHLQTDPLPDMTSQPPKNRELTFRNMMKKIISDLWKGQLYNAARTHAGQPPGRKASYIQIAHDDLQRLDPFKPAQFYVSPTISFLFFDFELKPPITSLPTSILVTLTRTLRMPNDIASCVVPYKSLEMRLIPFSAVPISLHSSNLQSIASCSTFDNSTSGNGQLTQTPKM